jgi:uncharacterized protein YkwD
MHKDDKDCLTGSHYLTELHRTLLFLVHFSSSLPPPPMLTVFFNSGVYPFMNQFKYLLHIVLLCMSMSTSAALYATPTHDDAEMQKMILYYVNNYRVKHHLPALQLNMTVSNEAAKHSQAMASKIVGFGHAHFNERIKRLYQQFDPCRGGAENVAYYKTDAKRLVDAWVSSPGHRRNIMGQYNVTGIGIAYGKTGWAYYTQIFLHTDKSARG